MIALAKRTLLRVEIAQHKTQENDYMLQFSYDCGA